MPAAPVHGAPVATGASLVPSPMARFTTARKPAGGFLFLSIPLLLAAWLAYRSQRLPALALRGFLACLEMQARRCQKDPDTPAHYGPDELAALLGTRPGQARAVLHQLAALGFLTWLPSTLEITQTLQDLPWLDRAAYATLRAEIPRRLHRVPIPRRLVRWLVRRGSPGLLATVLGVTVRCMRYRSPQCNAGGSLPLPWLSTCFGLQARAATRHLRHLERLGWLTPVPTAAWHQQRYGRWYVPSLTWSPPPPTASAPQARISPLRAPRQLQLPFPPAAPATPAVLPTGTTTPVEVALPAAPEALLPAVTLPAVAPPADAQTPAPSALPPAELEALASASLRQQGVAEDWLIAPVVQAEIDRLQADPACTIVVTPATDACTIVTTDSSVKPIKATASVFSLLKPLREKTQQFNLADADTPGVSHESPNTPENTGSQAPTGPDVSANPALDVPQETFPATTFAAPVQLPLHPVDTATLPAATLQPSAEVFADIARFFQQSALAATPPLTDTLRAPALSTPPPDAALPPATASPPTVAWGAITPEHLQDLPSLVALHQLASDQGWLDRSEATRLALVTAAIHARRLGYDPAALFVSIVRQRRWSLCTTDDEDRARHWLRQGQPSPPPQRAASWLLPAAPPPAQAATVPLEADAALARDILQVLGVVGRQRDPWPLVAAQFAGDRARWDAALVALEHWHVLQAQANARHRAALAALALEDEADTDEDRDARDTEEA